MSRHSGQYERYCFDCGMWFDAPSDNKLAVCPKCGKKQRMARCNRCQYEWKLHRLRYPDNCPSCKNSYYNIKRIQTRENVAKRFDE